jgi:hypothetical protein
MKIAFLSAVVGVAVGGFAMWVTVSHSQPPPRNAPLAADPIEPAGPREIIIRPTAVTLGEEEKSALRALIREELRAQAANAAVEATTHGVPKSPEETLADLSPEARKTYETARARVDDAIRQRAWSEDDRMQLRQTMLTVPPELAAEIRRSLIVAVNNGDVRFSGRGPLF